VSELLLDPIENGLVASALRTGKLHLGAGDTIFEGWTNVDIDPGPGGFSWDLSEPLPLPDASVRYIFSEHFIEHLTHDEGLALMSECRRVLKDDGGVRLSTPDLDLVIKYYEICVKDERRLDDFHQMDWRPATACALINEAMHRWGHQYLYNASEIDLLFRQAGFTRCEPAPHRESKHEALRGLEIRPFWNELIFEAYP